MKRFVCLVLCLFLLLASAPSSFAVVSKEQIYSVIDPMIDQQDYEGIANYFTLLKNEANTISGTTKPYIKGDTLVLPSNLTAIDEETFAHDVSIKSIIIPDSVVSIADNAFYGIPNLTIVANETSYAYTWALNKGYSVKTTPDYETEFTITLTADNFDEFFEFVVLPEYNSFGEIRDECYRLGVRSKLYDYGFVIKNLAEMSSIVIELTHSAPHFSSSTMEMNLRNLLCFGSGTMPGNWPEYDIRLSRVLSGNITYTSLVESYTLENRSYYDRYTANVLFVGVNYPNSRPVVDGYLY